MVGRRALAPTLVRRNYPSGPLCVRTELFSVIKLALKPEWMTETATQRIVTCLGEVRFVGGCVRDTLAGRTVHDIDIATPLPPTHVMRLLQADGIRAIPTGLSHGTVTAVIERKVFEITTLRRDVETDGRHAIVVFTDDWIQDARRRDFTINALSCSPDGMIYDPFGGVDDLKRGVIRFVGDPESRIREDLLRLLRFFRFYAHYGQRPLDDLTLKTCRDYAPCLIRLAGERIKGEVFRLLAAGSCAAVWRLMLEQGIVPWVLSGATAVWCLERLVDLFPTQTRTLVRLAALFLASPNQATATATSSLRLSRVERNDLRHLFRLVQQRRGLNTENGLRVAITQVDRDQILQESVMLAVAARLISMETFDWVQRVIGTWREVSFPLNGDDLMAVGFSGPQIGLLLTEIKTWWAENRFEPDRAQCLDYLIRNHR